MWSNTERDLHRSLSIGADRRLLSCIGLGGYRDPSNTRRDLREARGTEDLAWVTSHNFRKTTATILDDAGLSSRSVADQLGHVRPSMTQDVYLSRKLTDRRAADALEGARGTQSAQKYG